MVLLPSQSPVSKRYDCHNVQSYRQLPRTRICAKQAPKDNNSEDSKLTKFSLIENFQRSPGTLIAAPFVILIGADLVLNIVVLAKRTVEYFVFGKIPSTEVWFSDNFFF